MRVTLFTFLGGLLLLSTASAQEMTTVPVTAAAVPVPQRELIIVSGGPALRTFERDKAASHDKFWGNFIDAATLRIRQLQAQLKPGETITWLVYRPGYSERGAEMVQDLLGEVMARANKTGVNLMWFDRAPQVVNYLNKGKDRKVVPIALFEYFGHSNKACFLFDYSNGVDGMSIDYLHVRDLSDVNRNDFSDDARSKSWGCHSGELFSATWKKRFGTPMEGAIGKTDYSRGGLPFLSSDGGRWAQ